MTTDVEPDNSPKPAEFTLYHSFLLARESYLAVRKNDTLHSPWHVVGANGDNYGAWQSIENFQAARREALKLTPGEKTDKIIAVPIGQARLSVRGL